MNMRSAPLDYWWWFDFETTGLWTRHDEPPMLMELGFALLPFGKLDPGDIIWEKEYQFPITQYDADLMATPAYAMHKKSGLLEKCLDHDGTWSPAEAERNVLANFKALDVGAGRCGMAGTGIGPFDIPLLRLYMPQLYEFFYYAPTDLGTGRRALENITHFDLPDDLPDSSGGHTALADVRAMLRQAQALRDWSMGYSS